MSEMLYIKYNSHRRPEYQLSTRIVASDSGKKKVIKLPITKQAGPQIRAIKKNFLKLTNYYKAIVPIEYKDYENGLSFEFVEGKSVLSGIDFSKDDLSKLKERLLKVLDEVLDVKDEYLCEFAETEAFKKVFPDKHPSGKAFKICNLDSIFSNFIRTTDGIKCIDYEWVLDFPVPINFIKYRMFHYLYEENGAYLSSKATFEEFIDCLELTDEEKSLYADMEMDFQYLVHGENVKYIYLENYKKRMVRSEKAYQLIDSKDNHINNLEKIISDRDVIISGKDSIIEDLKNDNIKLQEDLALHSKLLEEHIEQVEELSQKLQKIKKCFKNPFYGAFSFAKFVGFRLRIFISHRRRVFEQQKEEKRVLNKAELDKQKYEELSLLVDGDYESWITRKENQYKYNDSFDYKPLISIIVPVYNVEDRHLIPCIDSVKAQIYPNWELILIDDCSTFDNVRKTLKKKSRWNKKIQVITRNENGGISRCTNTGIEIAGGDYIAFMDCDDTIAPFALYEVVKKLNEEKYDFVYSDEDKLNDDGSRRHDPFFKPDWSPDTLMSYMYTSHLGVYKTEIVKEIGGLKPEYDGCQDYDLTLRFTEKTSNVGHISKVLYHWREREESTASDPESKSYVRERTLACKREALNRRNYSADLEWLGDIYQYRVRYIPEDNPLVSIIIPSKDNPKILEQCLKTLREKTNYAHYEITIVDNGSSDVNKSLYEELSAKYKCRYVFEKMEFNFSKMCNIGAFKSKGDYFLFLNDDIEIINTDWLERMVGQVELAHVGAVGAKLLYPGTTLIQHDGVISIESGPVHEFAKMDDGEKYYFNRNRLDFDVLAVTAACLIVSKDHFNEVGGFDEELAVAYNDIDLCIKLYDAGYYNVIRNDAILYHHESISRGDDAMDPEKFERLMNEQDKLYEQHPKYKKYDPFYNENLTQTDCDFSNDYEADYNYVIKEVDYSLFEEDDSIKYGIDIARHDWCTYIEGWAFKEGFDDNINLETKILLVSEKKSYLINTSHVRREDVVNTFSDENCISFCGCKARLDRKQLPKGTYSIRVVCNDRIALDDKKNENSIDTIII